MRYTLAHQTKCLHMEPKVSYHKQYLFALPFPRNVNETHTDQSILQTFLTNL